MMSSIRRRNVFPSSITRIALLAAFVSLLATAAPCSAQISSTPAVAILNPGTTTTFTITVPAGEGLQSVSVLTMGAPNLDFTSVAAGTTCPNLIAGTCKIQAQFQPTKAGRRQGAVLIIGSTAGDLLSISLDGAGSGAMLGFGPSTISTFAGKGIGGDGGPAASAQLAGPTGFAVDGFGNYYIADRKANKVRKVSTAGVISTFAGTGSPGYSGDGGLATRAQLNAPVDVVVDGAGFVYISDTNNNVVRVVDQNGIITTYAGQYYAPGTTPPPVCAAATNSVGDGCPGNKMVLNTPMGLVFCHAQNLHIADKLNNRVRTVNRVGYNTFTQVGNGVQGYNGDGELNTDAELNGPTGMDFDAANYIYVADTGNHVIRKTLLTGTIPNPIATVAGIPSVAGNSGDGGLAINAALDSPMGVRIDPAGDIYISDPNHQIVRKVNVAAGTISTIVGNGAAGFNGDGDLATSAQLNSPWNMFVDEKGNLFITDTQNAAIREVSLTAAPSLTFPSTGIGGVSVPTDVTVMNLGSAPLNITGINTTSNYSLSPDSTCSASVQTLSIAGSCVLGIELTPKTGGSIAGTIVLTDNAPSGTQTITLNGSATTTAGYTLIAKTPAVSITAGTGGAAMLSLTSNSYSGTISFVTSVSSTDGTATDVTATAGPVTLSAGGTVSSTVNIAANMHAANHNPANPWNNTGAPLFGVVLIGLPFAFRWKQLMPTILLILAISLGGFLTACSGATSSAKSGPARTYVVTATPTASPMGSVMVTNPSPTTITVTVQ